MRFPLPLVFFLSMKMFRVVYFSVSHIKYLSSPQENGGKRKDKGQQRSRTQTSLDGTVTGDNAQLGHLLKCLPATQPVVCMLHPYLPRL